MSNPGTPGPAAAAPPTYNLRAKALWDLNGERLKFVSTIQADYGKWLIVTVTSVHLAGLYLVSQASVPVEIRTNPSSFWPFIIGVCLILIAGLITWANWSMAAGVYSEWMRPSMLDDPKSWPTNVTDYRRWLIPFCFWASLAFGIASAICIPVGAYQIFHNQSAVQTHCSYANNDDDS
jgi:hypothetical protein